MFDPGFGFRGIGGPHVDDVAERCVAQEAGAGERTDERNLALGGDRLGCLGCRGADGADQSEDLVVVDQFLDLGNRLVGLVAVIVADQLNRASVYAAGRIDLGESRVEASAHSCSQRRCRSLKRRRLAKHDLGIGNAVFRAGREWHHGKCQRGYGE